MKNFSDHMTFQQMFGASGCYFISIGGVEHCLTYWSKNGLTSKLDTSERTTILFANRLQTSHPTATIRLPVKERCLKYEIYPLHLFIPFLLSLQNMTYMGIYLDYLSKIIINKDTK